MNFIPIFVYFIKIYQFFSIYNLSKAINISADHARDNFTCNFCKSEPSTIRSRKINIILLVELRNKRKESTEETNISNATCDKQRHSNSCVPFPLNSIINIINKNDF